MPLSVRHVDPRDMRFDVDPLAYQVYVWPASGGPVEAVTPAPDGSELTDARDVHEVLAWAADAADGREYTVYAVHELDAPGRGMVHLGGVDPTKGMSLHDADPDDLRLGAEPLAYRIYFWRPLGKPRYPGGAVVWESDEWELAGARDVDEAIEWAEAHAEGRDYTLYAVHERVAPGRELIRLHGVDPAKRP